MRHLLFSLLLLLGVSAYAGVPDGVVIAPNKGYCSRLGELWVVVRYQGTPEVFLDGKKVDSAVVSAEAVKHVKVLGIRPGGSELKVKMGDRTETMRVEGYEAAGKKQPSFHKNGWQACQECHEYKPSECRNCHAFEGHKHADYLKCENCHKEPGVIPLDAAPLCERCHKDMGVVSHKKMKHPVSAAIDPKRPGVLFNCVSCHNPHTPKCLDGMQQGEFRQWCKGCHSR